MSLLWEIQLLGGLRVSRAGEGGPGLPPFERRNVAVLLAYLACSAGKATHREEIADLLWPDATTAKGRQNLNGELSHLRAALNAGGIPADRVLRADRDFVCLSPEGARIDVREFEAACTLGERAADEDVRREQLRLACDLYRGPFLDRRCDLNWAANRRDRMEEQYLNAVRRLTAMLPMNGEHADAVAYARQAVALHESSEDARCVLLQALLTARDYPRGRSECLRWREWLRAHGGLEPGDEFLRLEEAFQSEEEVPPPPPLRPPDPSPFPPPLPATFGAFVGREAESERLRALLLDPRTRLVTLHGPGGSGKTRLAVETAHRLRRERQVWFVGLSGLDDARRIPERLLRDLGADPGAVSRTADPLDAVAAALEGEPTLLVLDNFEHLAAHGGVLIRDLLSRAPDLTCLVTSRQTLSLSAERQFALAPLPVPEEAPADDPWIPERLEQNPSVALFADRARRRSQDFALTYENADAVAALCRHLEGLPLALELAASWVPVLTPRQMLVAFRNLLEMVGQDVDLPESHRSLEATLRVSYALLPDENVKRFFARLCVFAGSWDYEATRAIAGNPEDGDNHLPSLAHIMHLTNASLLRSEERPQGMRYRMLGAVRAFAEKRLNDLGEADAIRERHRAYYAERMEEARPLLEGREQGKWLASLEADLQNLRLTLSDLEADRRIRLATGLHPFWESRGLLREGIDWLREALLPSSELPHATRIAALAAAVPMARTAGDEAECERLLALGERLATGEGERAPFLLWRAPLCLTKDGDAESQKAARHYAWRAYAAARRCLPADSPDVAEYCLMMGYILKMQGKRRRAYPFYRRALELCEPEFDRRPEPVAKCLNNLGAWYEAEGRFDEARDYLERALAIDRELLGDRHPTVAIRFDNLGRVRKRQGDLLTDAAERRAAWREAYSHHSRALAIYREIRPSRHLHPAMTRFWLGQVLCALAEWDEALECLDQALPILEERFPPGHPIAAAARAAVETARENSKKGG